MHHVVPTSARGAYTIPDGVQSFDATCCDGIPPIFVDERGYELRHICGYFQAGCRTFSSAEDAIAHWGGRDYLDQRRGAAFVAAIRKAVAKENTQ